MFSSLFWENDPILTSNLFFQMCWFNHNLVLEFVPSVFVFEVSLNNVKEIYVVV